MNMNTKQIDIPISGMSCASCAAKIEKGLSKAPGVVYANVNFATEKATVEFDTDVTTEKNFIDTVKELGYEAKIQSDDIQKVTILISGMTCAVEVKIMSLQLYGRYRVGGLIGSMMKIPYGGRTSKSLKFIGRRIGR